METEDSRIDAYIATSGKWKGEVEALREIALTSGLREEVKWGKPCYTYNGKNIVLIQAFKAYCAFLFFKGYLLEDTGGILVKTGENTVKGRQARFHSVEEIAAREPVLRKYIRELVELEDTAK